MKLLRLFILTLAFTGIGLAPALAEKPSHAFKHEKQEKREKADHKGAGDHNVDAAVQTLLRITGADRDVIRTYLRKHHGGHCPPGLAKKRNGCLPPGQAKKYAIGGYLPPHHAPVPADLLALLGPPPAGAFYAMVDTDVVLVAEAGKKILDAVTLLSAVNN